MLRLHPLPSPVPPGGFAFAIGYIRTVKGGGAPMRVVMTVSEDAILNPDGSFTPIRPLPEGHEFTVPPAGEFLPCYITATVTTEAKDHDRVRVFNLHTVGPDRRGVAPPMPIRFDHRSPPNPDAEMEFHGGGPARFPARGPGDYEVRIFIDGEVHARRVLRVR